MEKANLLKVKVYPKDLKAIPDILPFRALIQGEPLELELTKKEIWRCMHFGDVFDLSSGEEVLIDRPAYNEIVEYIKEDETVEDTPAEDGTEDVPTVDPQEPVVDPEEPVVDPQEPVVDPEEPVVDPQEPTTEEEEVPVE